MVQDPNEEVQQEEKDRNTQQFEKLTNSNKELKEERDQKAQEAEEAKAEAEKYKRLYDSYQQPTNQAPNAQQFSNLNQQQVNQTFSSMVDENGFLDGNKLMNVLQNMNNRAIQAEQRAQRAEQTASSSIKQVMDSNERTAQAKVYTKYPQLDPNNKEEFDPKMWRAVYNELAVKAKAGENPTETDYVEAADRVYDDFYSDRDMSKKSDEQKQVKQDQKKAINAVRPTSGTQVGYYSGDDDNDLLKKVQQGKRGAIAEMLKRREQ